MYICQRRWFLKEDEDVIASCAVRVQQERVVAQIVKLLPPGEGRGEVAPCFILSVDRVWFVQIEVEGEPFARVIRMSGVEADQMLHARATEMAGQLVQGHHVGAAHGFLR